MSVINPDATEWQAGAETDDGPIGRARTTSPAEATNTSLSRLPAGARSPRRDDVEAVEIPVGEVEFQDDASPIAVRAVQERAADTFEGYTLFCPASPGSFPGDMVRLFGRDSDRTRALISNTDCNNPILVGTQAQIGAGQGFTLPPGSVMEVKVQRGMYACVPASVVQTATLLGISVGVYVERG